MGPVRTAPVVLLTLNGGLNGVEQDEAKITCRAGANGPESRWGCSVAYVCDQSGGREWTERRLAQFGLRYKTASTKVAFVNLIPYRSREGAKDLRMLERLESTRLVRAWAHDTLFLEAEAGKRVVVYLRSARAWGLEPDTQRGLSLFTPKFNRAGFMLHGPMREKVSFASGAPSASLRPRPRMILASRRPRVHRLSRKSSRTGHRFLPSCARRHVLGRQHNALPLVRSVRHHAVFFDPVSVTLTTRYSHQSFSHGYGSRRSGVRRATVFGSRRVLGAKRNLVASVACNRTAFSQVAIFSGSLAASRAIKLACTKLPSSGRSLVTKCRGSQAPTSSSNRVRSASFICGGGFSRSDKPSTAGKATSAAADFRPRCRIATA